MVRACSIDLPARTCEGGLCSDGNYSTSTTRTASPAPSRTRIASGSVATFTVSEEEKVSPPHLAQHDKPQDETTAKCTKKEEK